MLRSAFPFMLSALLLCSVQAQSGTPPAAPRPTVQITLSAADRALDSVVSILAVQPSGAAPPGSRGWSPFPGTLLPWLGTGTGFLVGPGEILTSHRLVLGNETVSVKSRGGQTFQARVVGRDPERDLALLRVTNPPASLNRSVTLGNSDRLTSGQKLIALGMTRDGGFTAQEVTLRAVGAGTHELTLDTALNAEARGGPLLNAAGEVVALNTGRFGVRLDVPFATGASGAALPINAARAALADLRSGRTPQAGPQGQTNAGQPNARPRLGVQIMALSTFPAGQLREVNLPAEGVLVQGVLSGSPAAQAGLSAGSVTRRLGNATLRTDADVIVAVNGQRVRTVEDVQRAVQSAGATVELEVVRSGQSRRVSVTLGPGAATP